MLYWPYMVLVLEKKFLEGVWWQYGLALGIAKLVLWISLAYRWQPDLDWGALLRQSNLVFICFFVDAFLTFVYGRLQLRRLFWFSLSGFFLAEAGYLFLVFAKFGRVMNLLPFVAFMQLYVTFVGLGLVVELGRYAYLKLTE